MGDHRGAAAEKGDGMTNGTEDGTMTGIGTEIGMANDTTTDAEDAVGMM